MFPLKIFTIDNCYLPRLNSSNCNLPNLIISVFVATMIYHVYHACARLRIFLVHKGSGFIPNSGAGFVSWVFSMARTRRRLILIPSARNLRSLFLLASWSALRFWEAVLLRADDGKYRSVSLLSLARAARALLNFSARNSRTRSNPRRTVDSTRVQQRDQAPVVPSSCFFSRPRRGFSKFCPVPSSFRFPLCM